MDVDAERFDPPCRRVELCALRELAREDLLEILEGALDGDRAVLGRMLEHRGLQIGGRAVGSEDLPERIASGTRILGWALEREPEPIPLDASSVRLDEEGIVAVAKPAWLPVQGTRASQRYALEAELRRLLGVPTLRAAHRLDRETSGLVLFTRDREAAAWLGRALARHEIERQYLAIVSPAPERTEFTVEGEIVRRLDSRRIRFALVDRPEPRSRSSSTRFRVVASRGGGACVLAEPRTGRSHQIRVHLAAAGSPIVGDRLYGAAQCAGRTLLHAFRLRLRLPSGVVRSLEAEPPEDLARAFAGAEGNGVQRPGEQAEESLGSPRPECGEGVRDA